MFILYIKILHFSNVKDVSEVLEISTFDDDDNIQDDFPCDLLGKVLEQFRTEIYLHISKFLAANPLTEYREW